MTVFKNAVTGFNHNVRHKGKTYHVQTEDSGVANPHVITHLFVGGNILASKKTSYADLLKAPNLAEQVRSLMETQHKAILRGLIGGAYDALGCDTSPSFAPGQIHTESGQVQVSVGGPVATESHPPIPLEIVVGQDLEGEVKPREGGETLFGDDLISEKRLDEVILQYLAGERER